MDQRDHRAGAESDILKPEPDIEQHADCRDGNRHDGIDLRLGADRGTDRLRRDQFHFLFESGFAVDIHCHKTAFLLLHDADLG